MIPSVHNTTIISLREFHGELFIVSRFQNAQRQVGEALQVISRWRRLEGRAGTRAFQIENVPASAPRRVAQRSPMPRIADNQMTCGCEIRQEQGRRKGTTLGISGKFPIESHRETSRVQNGDVLPHQLPQDLCETIHRCSVPGDVGQCQARHVATAAHRNVMHVAAGAVTCKGTAVDPDIQPRRHERPPTGTIAVNNSQARHVVMRIDRPTNHPSVPDRPCVQADHGMRRHTSAPLAIGQAAAVLRCSVRRFAMSGWLGSSRRLAPSRKGGRAAFREQGRIAKRPTAATRNQTHHHLRSWLESVPRT